MIILGVIKSDYPYIMFEINNPLKCKKKHFITWHKRQKSSAELVTKWSMGVSLSLVLKMVATVVG